MSIEWDKIMANPSKGYKTTGQNLLDLKNKIGVLEKEIMELTNTRNELTAKLEASDNRANSLDEKVRELSEELGQLKQNTEMTINEIRKKSGDETTTRDDKISDLEASVSDKDKEIKYLNEQIAEMQPKAVRAEALENKVKDLEALENKVKELGNDISTKEAEIEELKQQVPKKPKFEKAEKVEKGKNCPKCGFPTYKEFNDQGELIRNYCPNTSCGWSSAAGPSIQFSMDEAAAPEAEVLKELKIYKVIPDGIQEADAVDSSMVAIVADPDQNILWIWKGKDSSRFDQAEATQQVTKVKMDITHLIHAKIDRVDEGEEPANFPKLA